ncbi:hypothetical protein DHD05_13375 [Arenibacter sp. N53]|uniref:hypothetical protein n=1 Tax=Arenibacter TaxID=178469 RepID=UPI000CD4950A|nr:MULTISPECIES: hypothetical protein [Arenibacter]MCM4152585.1 hypothetical protein [Arenibacter sp. N53]
MKNKLLFYLLTTLTIYGCSKDDQQVDDPQIAILGKWELTHSGTGNNAPAVESIGYEEYMSDSIFRFYNYAQQQFYTDKFWLNDSLLIKSFSYIDVVDSDTILLVEPYKYEFINRNKLILYFQYPAIQTTFIYKRIK